MCQGFPDTGSAKIQPAVLLPPGPTLASATEKRRSILRSRGRVPVRFIYGELLVQGEVLEGELAVAAAEEREESEQMEQEGDHRARIFSG